MKKLGREREGRSVQKKKRNTGNPSRRGDQAKKEKNIKGTGPRIRKKQSASLERDGWAILKENAKHIKERIRRLE